jgi:hypothetical protein
MAIPQSVFSNNVFGFTTGGPVRRNRTFFFAAFQQNNLHSTANFPMELPTAGAVAQLRAVFPNNPRLNLYLDALGDLRGTAAPFDLALGIDPRTGLDRGLVKFAAAAYTMPSTNDGPQWLGRLDHYQSERHRLSLRYTYDSRAILPYGAGSVSFPGFIQQNTFSHHNVLFADTYALGPSDTNEFRFSYGRPESANFTTWPGSNPLASSTPNITIANISAPGVNSQNAAFHNGDSFLFQDTQTKLTNRHAFRYGLEIVQQLITQQRGANDLGSISYTNSVGYSAFANFLDDFSGPAPANANRVFGAKIFHPNQFRQAYFLQDGWKVTPALELTLGLRYENFGQIANSLPYPAFTGFDPTQFLVRRKVNPDNKDFGPAFGIAWSPAGGKSVLRGGYQVSYDAPVTQLLALGPATSTPNAISVPVTAPPDGRGVPNWYEQLPASATAPRLSDNRVAIDPNFRNPYTERWSFGLQRHLPQKTVLDVSYVGSESHRLTTKSELNPRLSTGTGRIHAGFGSADIRTSEGNSSYHALQARLERRFGHGFQWTSSYTWSKAMDSTSDGVANIEPQSQGINRPSIPVIQGGLRLDHAVSDFDRPHRLTLAYLWAIPGPRSNWSKYIVSGWSTAGILTVQSGTPFSVANGPDRLPGSRPDIGNPAAPLNTRAVLFPTCPGGYLNPDTGACVNAGDVHWIEGSGFPDPATVGRNTLRTGGTNDFDLNVTRSIPLGEERRLELRWEALNALNHPQFVQVPPMIVNGTLQGRFLNRDFTDSGIRTMWIQVKLVF